MDQALAELNQKIDALAAQVQFLTEQARITERGRQERAELMHDVMPVVNDGFRLATEQLEEIQQFVDLGDLLRLLKRLLRNGRNIEMMLDQVESLMDLAQTLGPLADSAFGRAVDLSAEAERKGYFAFARQGMRIADRVVTSFTEEDVRQLGDYIVLILEAVKAVTQPEILHFVLRTVRDVEAEVEKPVDVSYRALVRQMRDPDVRRGMALMMRVMGTLGARAAE